MDMQQKQQQQQQIALNESSPLAATATAASAPAAFYNISSIMALMAGAADSVTGSSELQSSLHRHAPSLQAASYDNNQLPSGNSAANVYDTVQLQQEFYSAAVHQTPAAYINASAAAVTVSSVDSLSEIRHRIASHPAYHRLLAAYVNCRKVGAPPEVARRLDQVRHDYEAEAAALQPQGGAGASGSDPELDQFMDAYCHILYQYHQELTRPFDQAMDFLSKIKLQIKDITKGCSTDDEEAGEVVEGGDEEASEFVVEDQQLLGMEDIYCEEEEEGEAGVEEEEGGSCGEVDYVEMKQVHRADPTVPATHDEYMNVVLNGHSTHVESEGLANKHLMRDQLLHKYKGYISTLKKEFMKKKKKGKLPKDARQCLLDWWNQHYKWPYPSETEKASLAESSGLDQKQINNWFINQRKRHWKPSDEPRYVLQSNGQDRPMHDDVSY